MPFPPETDKWFGRAYALVRAVNLVDAVQFGLAVTKTKSYHTKIHDDGCNEIRDIIYRNLAVAELDAPASAQGAFVPAGNASDAFAGIGKVLGAAKRDLLIVDPYMDEKTLTDFAPLALENVSLRLLTDQQTHKPGLRVAAERWHAQHSAKRPLFVRLAPLRTLHDRLIMVDGERVWILTQSLNAFASRAPASIVRVDGDAASLKIDAYEAMWAAAIPL